MISVPRRGFLALAGAVALGVTGCQLSDPVIHGGPTAPPPQPSPTPEPVLPGRAEALGHEVNLAALAEQIHQAAARLRLSPTLESTTAWLSSAHELHATALLHPQPTRRAATRPTPEPGVTPRTAPTPTVSLSAGTRDQAVAQLRDRLEQAVGDYRQAATGSQGPTALFWASLAAYARSAQTALTRDVARPLPPVPGSRELEPWSDAEAEQQTLRQVHALVYGYQLAIPWLPRAESQAAHGVLAQRRATRDRLAASLRERGQAAPAAAPAYELPLEPTDRGSAAELLWRMEAAYAPFAGAWLAAATDDDARRAALASLEQAAVLIVEWGGPLVIWPGWPD